MGLPKKFTDCPQWILWKAFWNGTKWDKIPVNIQGIKISGKDPANWLTFERCRELAVFHGLSMGFQFSVTTNIVGMDLDDCVNPETGEIAPWAQAYIDYFGSYAEISPSGTGLHILMIALCDHTGINAGQIELYSKERFFTVTGKAVHDVDLADCTSKYQAVVNQYAAHAKPDTDTELTDGPIPESNPILDDNVLIKKMLDSKGSANTRLTGVGCTIKDLWTANVAILSQTYPHASKPFDHSSADAALMSHLAFYTGKHGTRMERLFSLSQLGQRDKWTSRKAYRHTTIINSCGHCKKTYREVLPQEVSSSPQPSGAVPQPPMNEPCTDDGLEDLRTLDLQGLQLAGVEQQKHLFRDCAYVAELDKIATPKGVCYNKSQFNNIYGNRKFMFDALGEKVTIDAWKCFTNSQAVVFPKVDHTTFRPDLPPKKIITDEVGHKSINVYIPAVIASVPGDVSRFTNHMKLMIPNELDLAIVMAYIAACVQNIGYKFRWAPLIQGIQGNGKNLITECIAEAVGPRYCHTPDPNDISNKFNSWLEGNVMIFIDEVNVKGKYEMMDVLKTMLTSRFVEVQGKGDNKRMAHICCNFILLSNHKDAILKTDDDRRHCVVFCAQQTKQDLVRDGMTEEYFNSLFDWLKKEGGHANVTNYLQNYQIPDELNPATKRQRAPDTSSTLEAISYSLGPAEQAVVEAIQEERPGFIGGWVSSIGLTKLFKEHHITKQPKHRKRMMEKLGYSTHPRLPGGRAGITNMLDDGGRPILYIKNGSLLANLEGANTTARYLKDQGLAAPPRSISDAIGAIK